MVVLSIKYTSVNEGPGIMCATWQKHIVCLFPLSMHKNPTPENGQNCDTPSSGVHAQSQYQNSTYFQLK